MTPITQGRICFPNPLINGQCWSWAAPVEGIDQGADAAFFIGYHAMAGTPDATIAHTFTGRIAAVRINGLKIGEIGLNAMLAGYFGVPVVLVSGDEAGASEAGELLGHVETVSVKKGIGAYCLHPERCCQQIYDGAQKAMARPDGWRSFRVDAPTTLTVQFTTASGADRVLRMPGTERTNGTTVCWRGENGLEVFRAFNTMSDLVELVPFI
ncbi:D-aminopeptidase [Desulfonema ishimotonii]|uniref:D-aminopeptidase n=1 Tax=Desulfonema ishimotonii TaxID=45657 RepID=A0A401G464_9BACT|nr:D-aminopeptidase [Desulfonema ishimotonii]